jgi:hypothetical protein
VFLAVLFIWCRYGRKEAWLTAGKIAELTGLSERTVKAAIKDLVAIGVIRRIGRAGKFEVILPPQPAGPPTVIDGEDKVALPTCTGDCPSPNSTFSSSLDKERVGLAKKQVVAIERTLASASVLLGDDAGALPLLAETAHALGLPRGLSFHGAFERLRYGCNVQTAHCFTGAVLSLHNAERIQGKDLPLPG